MEKLLFLTLNKRYYVVNTDDISYIKFDDDKLMISIYFRSDDKIVEKVNSEVFYDTLQNIKKIIK